MEELQSQPRRPPVNVGRARALLRRGRCVVDVEGIEVVVVRSRRQVYAFENRCPHLDFELRDARVRGSTVTCRAHGFQFELGATEASARGCGTSQLRTFDVSIIDGDLWLGVAVPTAKAPSS